MSDPAPGAEVVELGGGEEEPQRIRLTLSARVGVIMEQVCNKAR